MPLSSSEVKFQEFFAVQSCLIAETSPTFSNSLRVCLHELGMLSGRIFTTSKFAIAKQTIDEKRPTILIDENEIERGRGFELVEFLEPLHENSKRLVVVTSKSSSMSVLMEAADGHVDCQMLKPFSIDAFRERIIAAAKVKLEPTPSHSTPQLPLRDRRVPTVILDAAFRRGVFARDDDRSKFPDVLVTSESAL